MGGSKPISEETILLDLTRMDKILDINEDTHTVTVQCGISWSRLNAVLLDKGYSDDLSGKIVVVSKADPGYDWIFGYNIGGLITQYGGAASHMAIRCAEFGIPAAIGCGEKIYSYVSGLNYLEIDCKNGKIIEVM